MNGKIPYEKINKLKRPFRLGINRTQQQTIRCCFFFGKNSFREGNDIEYKLSN